MKKPNIVFICTDQQRFDSLGCTGNPLARTPHLDAIAAKGVRFTHHSAPCPICSPSRASIFTGLYPRNHGLTINGMALDPGLPTLPGQLMQAGYRTHGVGKHHLQPILAPAEYAMPESAAFWSGKDADAWTGPYYGFQDVAFVIGEADQSANCGGHYAHWLRTHHPEAVSLLASEAALAPKPSDLDEIWQSAIPAGLHYNSWITDRAVEFIDSVDDPFFLYVSYPDPHHPFAPPRPYCDMFIPDKMPLPRVVPGELSRMPAYYQDISSPGQSGFLDAYWGSTEDAEQGFLLQTKGLCEASLRTAIAHTYGMVTMIDDGVGRLMAALQRRGLETDTLIIFTSDHGELLGDHGLLHKGPPAYRQTREVPLLVKGPGIPAGQVSQALTSHIDLMPTLLDMVGSPLSTHGVDGQSLSPLFRDECIEVRDAVYSEYHPRSSNTRLYNQTIQTQQWRLTLYPESSEWGELFDLENDPYEHSNLFAEPRYAPIIRKLGGQLHQHFPPQPRAGNARIAKW